LGREVPTLLNKELHVFTRAVENMSRELSVKKGGKEKKHADQKSKNQRFLTGLAWTGLLGMVEEWPGY